MTKGTRDTILGVAFAVWCAFGLWCWYLIYCFMQIPDLSHYHMFG